MFSHFSFNSQSRQLIRNIYQNANGHPMYATYQVEMDEVSYADAGAIAIKITKNGSPVNMFLFYPSNVGKIESCAIYGYQLEGHERAIRRSMLLFGLPVLNIEWGCGIEISLDVTLANY